MWSVPTNVNEQLGKQSHSVYDWVVALDKEASSRTFSLFSKIVLVVELDLRGTYSISCVSASRAGSMQETSSVDVRNNKAIMSVFFMFS